MQSCHPSQHYSFAPQWKPVPSWPKYEVGDDGRVRRSGKVIAARPQKNGYWRVTLSDGPRLRTFMLHRLVALAFHGSAPTLRHQVDHRNGVKANCRSDNLRWATPRQNRQDGRSAMGSRNGASVLTETKVAEIRRLYDHTETPVEIIAGQFGVSRQTITKIGRRRGWTHI